MRKKYEYRVIRYFYNPRNDEFFNIGVIVFDDNKPLIKIAERSTIMSLEKLPWINKNQILDAVSVYINAIDLFNDEDKVTWIRSTGNQSVNNIFANSIVSSNPPEQVLNELFDYYLGEKQSVVKRQNTKELKEYFSKKAQEIIDKKYSRYLRTVNKIKGFDRVFHHKITNATYCLLLGSTNDKYNAARILENAYIVNRRTHRMGVFGDVEPTNSDKTIIHWEESMKKLSFKYYLLSDETHLDETISFMAEGKVFKYA